MARYQKPTVEEIEDEARKNKGSGYRVTVVEVVVDDTNLWSAASEVKTLKKRKCPWENTKRLSKMTCMHTACR